jgi:hypothetical protein
MRRIVTLNPENGLCYFRWRPSLRKHSCWNSNLRSSPSTAVMIMGDVLLVDSSWNVMAHGDAREEKWRGNWRMEWVASTLHITSERGVSNITTADTHISAASSRLNWRPRRFKWTRPFRRKTKSVFCPCAITFQLTSTATFTSWHGVPAILTLLFPVVSGR